MNITQRQAVKTGLLSDVLGRILTRNIKSKVERTAARLGFMRNIADLSTHPERHLMACLSILDRLQSEDKSPPFETGLMLGATLAVSCGDVRGMAIVRKMLNDISSQQDEIDEVEPTPEPCETAQDDESGALSSDDGPSQPHDYDEPPQGAIGNGAL